MKCNTSTIHPPGTYIMSLGMVPSGNCVTSSHVKNTNMLYAARRRAIIPHDCDLRYRREEYYSDVSDTDDEKVIMLSNVRRSCLRDKSKSSRHGRRIVINVEKIVHYYPATIYFGDEPSPYSTRNDYHQRLPTSVNGWGEERVDPGVMPRVNDSHLPVPDTRRRYESSLPFKRQGAWDLARAVAIARAV